MSGTKQKERLNLYQKAEIVEKFMSGDYQIRDLVLMYDRSEEHISNIIDAYLGKNNQLTSMNARNRYARHKLLAFYESKNLTISYGL